MQKAVVYDLLRAVPDLVSDEEKLIDFEASVSKEAGPSVESCTSSASAPAAPTPIIVELTEEAIPEIAKVGGAKTIGPKRTGPRSAASSAGSRAAPRSRGRRAMNMELEETLADARRRQR